MDFNVRIKEARKVRRGRTMASPKMLARRFFRKGEGCLGGTGYSNHWGDGMGGTDIDERNAWEAENVSG
jgi:hypothetical protein